MQFGTARHGPRRGWADDVEAWLVASWLTTRDDEVDGRTPVEALRDGDLADVVHLAGALREGLNA